MISFLVKCIFGAIIVFQIQTGCLCAELPANFKRCEVASPKFHECVAIGINGALKDLKSGSTQLGIPSVDPIEIPELNIGEGKGAVNLAQNLKNVKIHGISSSSTSEVNIDFDKGFMKFVTLAPNITMEADYDFNGSILSLPIRGKGHLVYTFTDAIIQQTLTTENFTKKGNKYQRVTKYKIDIKPKKLHFDMDNLFNGDNQLRDTLLQVMNDNWEVLFEDVHSSYEEALSLVFMTYANRVFERVPLRNIYIFQ